MYSHSKKCILRKSKIALSLSVILFSSSALSDTVKVEAEAFVNSGGTFNDNQPNPVGTYTINGMGAINFVNVGDFVDYNITSEGGEYSVEYLVGTNVASGPTIEILVNTNGNWVSQGTVAVPQTGWNNFQPLTPNHNVTLPAGAATIRLNAIGSNWQWNMESFTLTQQTPIDNGGGNGGDTFVVEMEDFDATGGRVSGAVVGQRGTPQDQHTVVDSVQNGDWIDYNINFPADGNYRIDMLASGQNNAANAALYVEGTLINEVPVYTGSQATFQTFELTQSTFISAGVHTIRVEATTSGANGWMWFGDNLTVTNLGGAGGDADNDGVNDSLDQCPNTPAGANVDATGCEIIVIGDADNDGVNDNLDLCPNTPAGASVDANGCEIVVIGDADNDGVNDNLDLCPNTPAGASIDANGCEIVVIGDADNDGVNDNLDQCPNTPSNEAANGQGCSASQGGGSGNAQSGLMYSELEGATNWSDANLNWARTTDFAVIYDSINGSTTEVYTGIFSDADGIISFNEHIDDSVRLIIAGQTILSDDSWDNPTQAVGVNIGTGDISPGQYSFELRIGNADGGSGPVGGSIGFGIDINGGTSFVQLAALGANFFTSTGVENGIPGGRTEDDIIIHLESFINTGATGRIIASDTVEGFGATATGVNFVTNGDWGDYDVTFAEPGTYKAFITYAGNIDAPEADSAGYGARIDVNGEPVAWGYFIETNSGSTFKEVALEAGYFVVRNAGAVTVRLEAIGGQDWQWSGQEVRFSRLGNVTPVPERHYNPADHTVAEVQGPATGLQYLKAPLAIPTANKVLKSDVWYTYPQNRDFWDEANGGIEGEFQDFGANGSFWGHPPEDDFYDDTVIMDWAVDVVNAFQNQGFEYTARGEFDWGFRWFTEYVSNPQPHFVRTLDDRNIRMAFMGHHSYNGYNNNWLSNHSPAFVPYMKSQVDQILKANPDKLMFDTQTNSTRTTDLREFGGDFSPYAMENFRIWLDKKYSSADLASLGINNINTFDYAEFLIGQGITHTAWKNAGNTISGNIPMLEDFIYFNRDVWNQKFAEVLDYIRETHPDIAIGASTQLFESRGYLFNENITFLANELFLDVQLPLTKLPTNIIAHLKAAEAVNKTLAYFPYPSEFKKLRDNNAPRFGRGWVTQAYAYGGLFSIPANVWVGPERTDTFAPGADNYRDIYKFARAQENLLDGYKSYSKVAVVHAMYSSMKANQLNGGNQVLSSTRILTEDNINFDLLVFGDEGYPVVPRQVDFDKFDHIFTDGDLSLLTTEQKAVLDAQGSKVRHIGQRGTIDGLVIDVTINGTASNEIVSAVSRTHETNANAPYVIHLINRPFAAGVTPTLNGVEITIPQGYFPENVTSATLHLPDGTSTNRPVTTNGNGDAVMTVNNLEVWGMLELGH